MGATVIEISLPEHIRSRSSTTSIVRTAEFKAQIAYAFEQAALAHSAPVTTPSLRGEHFRY